MYIVDKNKDYYDYLSHIHGVDKRVVYDRRNSTIIDDSSIVDLLKYYSGSYFKKESNFILLEIGYIQYIIQIYDIKFRRDNSSINYNKVYESSTMEIVHTFRNNSHYYDSPISIREVTIGYNWNWKKKEIKNRYIFTDNFNETITKIYEEYINNPILKNTQITSLIEPFEIWRELQNYISSLNNDKNVELPMKDVEKVEIHGFDKKLSFRNPIK